MTTRRSDDRLCTICARRLDRPFDPGSRDCGGDCASCMADAGDPDCVASLSANAGNDFPRLGINTRNLIEHVEGMLRLAEQEQASLGAVNWGDLGVADVTYRKSMMNANDQPYCVVLVEEASPNSKLAMWLYERLDKVRFPNTHVECE